MREPTRNERAIAQFRATGGADASDRPDRRLLLLTTAGRRSGAAHTVPLRFMEDSGRIIVFAVHGGSPRDPDWFLNLVAAGRGTVEVPGDAFEVVPVVLEDAERTRLYATYAARVPQYEEYQKRTTRVIPVVELRRVP